MNKVTIVLFALLGLPLASLPASSAILLNESFSYGNGTLTTVSGGLWSAHSAAGNKAVQVSGGEMVLVQSGGSGEDVNRALSIAQTANQKTYACFDLTVPVTGPPVVTTGLYFAHFKAGATAFRGRVFINAPFGGGHYTLGISNSGNAPTLWTADLTYNTRYKIAVLYDPTTATSRLWVDPATEGSPSVSHTDAGAAEAIDSFAGRQNTGGDSNQLVDNLVVGDTFADVCPAPTPAVTSTFGRIKSLYR
jgi:hypothetical protein